MDAMVTITIDADGTAPIEFPIADFEQSEQGAILGRRVIPWGRIRRITWPLPPRAADLEEITGHVRVVLDDGSLDGEEFTVPTQRFETMPWAIVLLLDDRVDADAGTVQQRRIVAPWHAVFEYERVSAVREMVDRAMSIRPDA